MKLGRRPPETWQEYVQLARSLRELGAKSGVKYGTVEPLGRGWAGQVLLARAAAYAKQRDNYTTLFDKKTFDPMVAGPPFVRALENWSRRQCLARRSELEFDPATARVEFWKGTTAMAISWPSASASALRTTCGGRRATRKQVPGVRYFRGTARRQQRFTSPQAARGHRGAMTPAGACRCLALPDGWA